MMDARPARSDRDAGKQCGLHGPLNNGSDERPLNVGISTTTTATANASCPTHMPMLLLHASAAADDGESTTIMLRDNEVRK